MSARVLIGFIGKAGSGKTTSAEHLEAQWGFHVYRFAHFVKTGVAEMTGTSYLANVHEKGTVVRIPIPLLEIEGGELPGDTSTLANLQIRYGEKRRNEEGTDVFCRLLWDQILLDAHRMVVIDDVRFPIEADFIRQKGGRLVRLERPLEMRIAAGSLCGRDPDHPTETALDDYADVDGVIENTTSDKDILKGEVDGMIVLWV